MGGTSLFCAGKSTTRYESLARTARLDVALTFLIDPPLFGIGGEGAETTEIRKPVLGRWCVELSSGDTRIMSRNDHLFQL